MATGAAAVLLVLMIAVPAFSASPRPAMAATPTPPAGEVIPLHSIDGLTSLTATVNLDVNGLIGGERAVGSLQADLTMSDQASLISVSGSLLGQVAAQVGGSLVGLFTPSSVDIYKVPEGTYIVVNSLLPVCIKTQSAQAPETLDELSPEHLLGMLTGPDVARGRYVGQETFRGVPVRHYVLDGEAFLTAAQASKDPALRAFGEALWSAEDADLYVDAKGGYPLAMRGSYSGIYQPLAFEGDFDVQIELTGVNTHTSVTLPSVCNRPIVP
jgi:hypothetical protein